MESKKKVTVLPYSDIFVRYLLGDEKNTDLLLSFINAVNTDYNMPVIKTVSIRNPYNLREVAKDKETILDVKATDESGEVYNIEIQSSGNETFKYRALYYWAKLYSSQIETGEKYYELKPAISINLLNFNLIDSEEVHSCFSLFEKNNHELMLTNHLLIHFIELRKFVQESNFQTDFENWMAFFKYEGKQEEIMQVVIDNNPVFAKAHDRFKNFTKNDELVELYEARQKWQMDRDTDIGYANIKGRQEGKCEDAKKMLLKGYSIDDIMDITGLTEEEVLKLKDLI